MKQLIYTKPIIHSLLIIAICLGTFHSFGQTKELRQLLNQTVTIDNGEVKIRAHILVEHHEFKVHESRMYHWFQSGEIMHTRGGYSGEILQGEYTEYFSNNHLKTNGKFHLGLKDGTWKVWYTNGEHKEIINWKNGVLHGNFSKFDVNGQLTESGAYKKGKLHGKFVTYKNGTAENTVYYKEGKEVTKEELEQTEKKEKKHKKKKTAKTEEEME